MPGARSGSGATGGGADGGAEGAADGTVDRAFAAALYADPAADGGRGLDTGASLLAADQAADPELRRRGERFLRRAWERGWQPADVVRLVRRDLDETHTRFAAELIATEAVRYERVAPRWGAQLTEIAADLEAGRAAGAAPRSADRFTYATTALELYRLLVRLPAIEAVGPVPGTPVHLPAADGEPRMLTRIRALLAKAERTDFPEEAEALSAKAQELMARHSIDEALLADRSHSGDVPAACRIGVDAPYETAKAILLDAVASANRCQSVWNSGFGFSTVVGFEPDLEVVELLYTSLLVQGTAAMTRAEAAQRAAGRRRTKTFRQSFLMAYAHRIGERLATAAEQATAERAAEGQLNAGATDAAGATQGRLLPVLAARDLAVADRAERMFPETVRTRVRGVTDGEGWAHGTAAADRARVASSQGS